MKNYYQLVYSPEWKNLTNAQREQISKEALYARSSEKFIALDKKISRFIDSVEQAVEAGQDDEKITERMIEDFSEITRTPKVSQEQIDRNKQLIFGDSVI